MRTFRTYQFIHSVLKTMNNKTTFKNENLLTILLFSYGLVFNIFKEKTYGIFICPALFFC